MLQSNFMQGSNQEGKKSSILYELGNKMQLQVWGHCEPLREFSG